MVCTFNFVLKLTIHIIKIETWNFQKYLFLFTGFAYILRCYTTDNFRNTPNSPQKSQTGGRQSQIWSPMCAKQNCHFMRCYKCSRKVCIRQLWFQIIYSIPERQFEAIGSEKNGLRQPRYTHIYPTYIFILHMDDSGLYVIWFGVWNTRPIKLWISSEYCFSSLHRTVSEVHKVKLKEMCFPGWGLVAKVFCKLYFPWVSVAKIVAFSLAVISKPNGSILQSTYLDRY